MDPSENSCWWNSCWLKLTQDIQAHILCRIQGKDLLSLKLVSWEWYDVISYICLPTLAPPAPDAAFCGFIFPLRLRKPVGLISPTELGFCYQHVRSNKFRYMHIEKRLCENYRPEDIQDCCNGILLVPLPPDNYHTHRQDRTQCCFASLAFDPTKSLNYKIICTPGGIITNPLNVETFSSKTGKWSRYAINIDSNIDGVEWIHRSAYLDGRLCRLLKTNYLVCVDERKSSQLLSAQAIRLPCSGGDNIYIDGTNSHRSIIISKGCLHYSTRDRSGSTLLVYMLKEDLDWLLKHNILIDDMLSSHIFLVYRGLRRTVIKYSKEAWFSFFAFHPNCDYLFLITPDGILFYSPEEKLLDVFHIELGNYEIDLGQNYNFPYSHCPVILQSAFQRASCANLDQHVVLDEFCRADNQCSGFSP